MLLRSRMHCLSLCDNPSTGTGAGRKGMPPQQTNAESLTRLSVGVLQRVKK